MRCAPLTMLFFMFSSMALGQSNTVLGDDVRKVWEFESPGGTRRIVHLAGMKWELQFPNGATNELIELRRTPECIEIRNLKNDNVIRVFSNYAESQKTGNGPFNRLAEGKWLPPEPQKSDGNDYLIRVVYFVPSDRQPVADFEPRIRNVLELIAEIMTQELRKKGCETSGPQFRRNDEGEIVVGLMMAEKPARFYNNLPAEKSPEHSQAIFDEVDRRSGDPDNNLTFIFAETYENGPADRLWPGHVAVAVARPPAGGIGVFSAWILKDEFCSKEPELLRRYFFDETLIPGRKAIGHKSPVSPRSEFMEDGVGGALHELAHTFGATHHGRGDNTSQNFMGQGFRNLRWNVGLKQNSRAAGTFSQETAWMLMTSRYLNTNVDRSDVSQPKLEVQVENKGATLDLKVDATDDRELSLLTIVEVTKDDGRQLIEARQLSGTNETIRIRLRPSQVSSGNPTLQFILVDGGGNHRKVSMSP